MHLYALKYVVIYHHKHGYIPLVWCFPGVPRAPAIGHQPGKGGGRGGRGKGRGKAKETGTSDTARWANQGSCLVPGDADPLVLVE